MRQIIQFFLLFFLLWSGTTPQVVLAEVDTSLEINPIQVEINNSGNSNSRNEGTADLSQKVDLTEVRGFLERIDQDVK